MGKFDELRKSMGSNIAESAAKRDGQGAIAPALGGLSTARMNGASRSKNAMEIALDRIVPDPNQPREEFEPEALARLADSLKTKGQLQPCRVSWSEDRGLYVIQVGERRWRAARMAGLATLSCVVADTPLEPGELLAIQLVENCVREDLKPIEQAKAYRTLMDQAGWSGNRLAQELGIAQSRIVHALALLELPEGIQERVEQGSLPPSTAYEISKAPDRETQVILAVGDEPAELVREGVEDALEGRRLRRHPQGVPRPADGRDAYL
jgi:ParB family transcriptional regulator, chromosome partitioning protein